MTLKMMVFEDIVGTGENAVDQSKIWQLVKELTLYQMTKVWTVPNSKHLQTINKCD